MSLKPADFLRRYAWLLAAVVVVVFAYQFGKDRALRDNERDRSASSATS